MQRVLSKIFGTSNDRAVKRLLPLVERVNVLEGEQARLSDADLRGLTNRYRERLAQGCLLYTSPSPRDKRQSRMPSSA